MIRENGKLYSDDRRFFTRQDDGYDAASDYVWINCEMSGLEDNTHGMIGYHSIYRPGNPLYSAGKATPEILAEMAAFQREADEWFKSRKSSTSVRILDATEKDRDETPKGVNPATTYVGQASMDAEDSIF